MQIVLLVTKAVSDFFGGGGIADQIIRFNGYPFLEKEDKEGDDHAFVESSMYTPCSTLFATADHSCLVVDQVMKRDLIVIRADGMPMQELGKLRKLRQGKRSSDRSTCAGIEEILQSTNYQGFPVVRSEDDATILGMIRKTELRYALGPFKGSP